MKISVYVTSYNQRELLREAVDSVLGQTLAPHQVIIVDDASTDGSQDVIDDYKRHYPEVITPIYHEKNTGVAQARRNALAYVTGDFVTYVDGDDRYLPHKLEQEAELFMRLADIDIVFSNSFVLNRDGERLYQTWPDDAHIPQGDIFVDTFTRNFPDGGMFRMELVRYASWKHIGFHDPQLLLWEDFDVRIRMTKQLRAAYVPTPAAEFRVGGGGLSALSHWKHYEALRYIFEKNHSLLDDLNEAQQLIALEGFGKFMAVKVNDAIDQRIRNSYKDDTLRNRLAAIGAYFWYTRHWSPTNLRADYPAKIILPIRIFNTLSGSS